MAKGEATTKGAGETMDYSGPAARRRARGLVGSGLKLCCWDSARRLAISGADAAAAYVFRTPLN